MERWVLCPRCRKKTRLKIREDTELRNFPLYCPKCRGETLVSVDRFHLTVLGTPDAQTQSGDHD